MKLHPAVEAVTERIRERSAPGRAAYLRLVDEAAAARPRLRPHGLRQRGPCLRRRARPTTSSRSWPSARPTSASSLPTTTCCRRTRRSTAIPDIIKDEARKRGATAQVAGGVPAMCDGVTQGTPGMELSLFSRDVIAMGTAVALSHDVFDARAAAGHLRQDRAGPADRRAAFRPPAHRLRAGRADAHRPVQQRQGQGARAGGAGPGGARGPAGRRDGGLPRAGHLHLLRHRQQQPDADGGHGPARAGHGLHPAGQCDARGSSRARRCAPCWDIMQGAPLRADRPHGGRARHRQCDGGAAGHRRLDQSPDPLGGGGARRRHPDRLERLRAAVRRGAAADARLSQRHGRRERVPGRRRPGLRDPRAARCRA